MKRLFGTFFLGLAALLPAGFLVYLTSRLFVGAERLARTWLVSALPEGRYIPGTGLLAALAVVLLVGLVARSWVGPPIGRWISARVGRIPAVGPVYLAIRDVARRFTEERPTGFSEAVFVPDGRGGGRLGLIADRAPLQADLGGRELVPVYFPTAFQPGGDVELHPPASLEPAGISLDAAMSTLLSGGLARDREL